MKTEPRYRKVVNQNGWMVKLQKLCFGGATPRFSGYCPFFWFTWFCLLFAIIIVPARLLAVSFGGAVVALADLRSRKPSRPKDETLLTFYDHYLKNGQNLVFERENNYAVWPKVLDWIDKTPDWENCAQQVWLKREERIALAEARRQRNAQRAKKVSSIVIWFGKIIKPIIILAGIAISYKIARILLFLISQITWAELIAACKWAVFIFIAVAAITLFINGVRFSVIWMGRCPRCPDKIPWYKRLFRPVGNLFGNILDFIGDTIETIYTRECPMIEWSDHSEPISDRD